ncbi:MAG: phosphatase PAP2 family protein [Actinomycetes bacterium]|jgi:membrane-associated phospholipid phosphatase
MFDKLSLERKAEMWKAVRGSIWLFLGFLIVTQQVLAKGYLYQFDRWVKHVKHHTFRGTSSHILLAIDDMGLRGFTATVLLISAALIGWRFKSFRPFNLSVFSLLLLNGVVGLSKLAFHRVKPRLANDLLHTTGLSYPSGHAANALLSWGLLAYLIFRYTHKEPFVGMRLDWLVGLITAAVCTVSLIRDTHWFSDLLGGTLLGGSLLVFVIAVDRAVPSAKQPS